MGSPEPYGALLSSIDGVIQSGRHMGSHWVVDKIVSHLGPDFPLFHDSLFLVPKVISTSNALDLSKRRNIAIIKTKFP